jgi:peptide/nickel transport system permease protein
VRTYLIRRVILVIPTLLLVSILVFLTIRIIPGSVVDAMVAEGAGQASLGHSVDQQYIRHALGLDEPVYVQYWKWLTRVARGDLGNSLWTGRSITQEMAAKLPISLELGIMAMIIGMVISVPIGIYSAVRQDTVGDYVGRTVAILMMSLPGFWIATIVIVFPSIWWGWTPSLKYIHFTQDPAGNLMQFIVPAVIMGAGFAGGMMRMTRTLMLEVLRQDYIRTAWAKGLSERVVIMRHALKNTMIPVITMVGMGIPGLLAGNVIFEQVFNLPGIGRYMLDAIGRRDYPIICATNFVIATAVLICNVAVDVAYGWFDPRVQYQ